MDLAEKSLFIFIHTDRITAHLLSNSIAQEHLSKKVCCTQPQMDDFKLSSSKYIVT